MRASLSPTRLIDRATRGGGIPPVGLALGLLWAVHAAEPSVPRQGYVLIPALLTAMVALVFWRLLSGKTRFEFGGKSGLALGLGCWFVAATLSAILNVHTAEVVLTYGAVFVCGAATYVALSGLRVTSNDLDFAFWGLAAGSMVPLVQGLFAFGVEWGVPDMPTVVAAYREVQRMASYEAVTFGNRGNTAAFVVIIAPVVLNNLLDRHSSPSVRLASLAFGVPIVLSLAILQVRAAFLTLIIITMVVWLFRKGTRKVPVLLAALLFGWLLLVRFEPDAAQVLSDYIAPVLTVDTGGDVSVQGRAEAIQEGIDLARQNWLLGVGPGGALTIHSRDSAHQFQVQQAMETGILGLLGATVFTVAVWVALIRTIRIGRRDPVNDIRFRLLIGPASYVFYSVLANAALSIGSINTWTVLVVSMLAIAPGMRRRVAPRPVILTRRQLVPVGPAAYTPEEGAVR